MYSAFTVAEVGEMLPEKVWWRGYTKTTEIDGHLNLSVLRERQKPKTDARAKMLIYLN